MEPEHVLEVFLQPGEFYWGDHRTRIRTLLGSCISFCFWHPNQKVGGMCHYILPDNPKNKSISEDPKYATGAMKLFIENIKKSKTRLVDYQVKIFGGANMFNGQEQNQELVGDKNIQIAKKLIQEYKLNVVAQSLGGEKGKRLHFDLWDGSVWIKK